jgi:16S rRNA (cytosine1402-N4)-methyltransferase
MHVPVMLGEALEYLAIRPDGIYLDATAGLGGHTAAVAERLTTGFVIANDRDAETLTLAQPRIEPFADRVRMHHGPFSRLPEALAAQGIERVDGLLADLGVSRYQLTEPERGFSLMADGPLDMRMDRSQGESAAELVNFSPEKVLADLIYQFGEERRSRRIARAIVRARPIRTTRQLARVIEEAAPRTGRLHPATQTFMALRIAVNEEMSELDALLELAPQLTKSGGRIVVITFMSLEDRKVKQSFQSLARTGLARILTRHVVRPAEKEIQENPPSRSAKMRAVEITEEPHTG